VGAIESRDATNRQLYRRIGDFLAAHALPPTPANYALVHELITVAGSPLAAMVAELTSDGVRLSDSDVATLREAAGLEPTDREDHAEEQAEIIAEARRSVENFASLVETTQTETSNYGRDLDRGASELRGAPIDDISALMLITGRMLERTRLAEAQLHSVTAEVSGLRERLQEAELAARSDPLTRLPNRRAFEDRLTHVVASGSACSLAICDIDHFKMINDSHGHPVGDRVLRMVAEVLQGACKGQLVARLGGEEFVVLFDGLDPTEAAIVLNAAREDLSERTFRVRGTDAPIGRITFSAGVARCNKSVEEPPLKRADALLYQAKDSGRNCVIVED
jgi:diguanylate cyclase